MAPADLTPLVAGNWKMNGLAASEGELAKIIHGASALAGQGRLMVCPPATLIATFAAAVRGSAVSIGGQDCHAEASGAHTGDIAAEMLKDAGAVAVIVGHSERRTDHQRDRCAGARQGHGRASRRADGDRLHRRAARRARGQEDAGRDRPAARRLAARWRTAANLGDRL